MPIETSPDAGIRSTHRQLLIAVLAIVTLVITAYSNSLDTSWHFDDEQNIVENRRLHLTELTLENIRQTFFASVNGRGDLFRPVACFSFALNYYFGKDHVFGYHNLGRTYAEKGNIRRALYVYKMALENPEPTHGRRHHVTHYNLAVLYQNIGDAAAAEAHLRRSLQLSPDNPEAHTNLAVLIAGKGRFAEAATHLQMAIDLDPLLQQARTNLGYMLIKLERLDNAVAVLKGALEMDPSDAKALYNLGIAYTVGDEREKAADCFEALLFKNPRAFLPRLFLAQVRLEMGRKNAARRTLELLADLLSPEELSESIDALRHSGPLETVPNESLLRPFLRPLIEDK